MKKEAAYGISEANFDDTGFIDRVKCQKLNELPGPDSYFIRRHVLLGHLFNDIPVATVIRDEQGGWVVKDKLFLTNVNTIRIDRDNGNLTDNLGDLPQISE